MDLELVAEVERRTYRAWLPAEIERVGGWTLRASRGFSRRLNSAAPDPRAERLDAGLDSARSWYAARKLPLLVRLTPPVFGLDAPLGERGFNKEGATEVMTADIGERAPDPGVEIDDVAGTEWLAAQRRLQGVPDALVGAWEATIARIGEEGAFALVRDGSRPIAAGIGVCEEDWMGLFEINVAASHRRLGIGCRLSSSLLSWGREAGARRAYLQVLADNHAAQALYRSLGFRKEYRYWYRREPAP